MVVSMHHKEPCTGRELYLFGMEVNGCSLVGTTEAWVERNSVTGMKNRRGNYEY